MSAAEPTADSRITVNGHEQGVQEHWVSNADVAGIVRMLMRDQFDHERVCTLGRDRILFLDQELRLARAMPAKERESFRPTHRHYKGGRYELLHRATRESDLRDLVVYRDAAGKVWVRDSVDFFTTVDGQPRFATIEGDAR